MLSENKHDLPLFNLLKQFTDEENKVQNREQTR